MKGRLQFRHDSNVYGSFEEVKALLENKLQLRDESIIPLYAEPAVFKYEDENHKIHLVLAIGNPVEDSRYENEDYKYTLLDLDPIVDGASRIVNVIEGVGFDEDGSFNPDSDYRGGRFSDVDPNISAYVKELKDKLFGINIRYDSDNTRVVLQYGDGPEAEVFSYFPANDFVKNELLRDVKVITEENADREDPDRIEAQTPPFPYLYMEWNTSPDGDPEGENKIVRISLKELVDVYTGGDGINVSDDYKISVVVDPSTESYLTLSPSGLKVAGIDAALEDVKDYAEALVEDAISDTDDVIDSVVSALTAEINENRRDIRKLEDFAEYKVGELDGEVIATVVGSNRDRISTLEGSVSNLNSQVANKVDKVDGKGLSTNDFTNEDKALLETVAANADENVIEIVKVNGVALDVNSDKAVNVEVPFVSLSETEKVLTLNNGVVESVISAEYDNVAKKIYLKGKNNSVLSEIDATDFIIDGMIKNVSVVTEDGVKYLRFIFNTDAGDRVINVALTDLVTEYTVSGDSENFLTIDGFKIGVKVDQPDYSGLVSGAALHNLDDKYSAITHTLDDKVGEGFVDESGATISITHKINELEGSMQDFIDENKLIFTEDFKVAGIIGTLGTGAYKNGDTITAGTAVLDVLKEILQKRLYPVAVEPSAKIVLKNAGSYRVGDEVSPSYEISFNPGIYNYDDGTTARTNVTVSEYYVNTINGSTFGPNPQSTRVGTFPPIVVSDDMDMKVYTTIDYVNNGYVPKTNLDEDWPASQIQNGAIAEIVSDESITGFRPILYGALNDGDIADYNNITSEEVLTLLEASTAETVSKIYVRGGSEVVVIMIPVNSDIEIKKIIDTDSGFDLKDVFVKQSGQPVVKTYEGEATAVTRYHVYVYDPGTQLGENVYKIIYA